MGKRRAMEIGIYRFGQPEVRSPNAARVMTSQNGTDVVCPTPTRTRIAFLCPELRFCHPARSQFFCREDLAEMANLSGAAVLLLVVVLLCMYTCVLLVGIQLGRAIERRPPDTDSVSLTFSIGEVLGYAAEASLRPAGSSSCGEQCYYQQGSGCSRNHTSTALAMWTAAQRRQQMPLLQKQLQLMQQQLWQQQPLMQAQRRTNPPENQRPPDVFDEVQASVHIPFGSSSSAREHVGPWGGYGGQPFYMNGRNASTCSLRGIILYHSSSAIHSLACDYSRRRRRSLPDGGSMGPSSPLRFHEIASWKWESRRERQAGARSSRRQGAAAAPAAGWVISHALTFRTSHGRKYGPYGNKIGAGAPFSVPAAEGACIFGFWGRSGWLVDAIGVYVRPCSNPAYKYTSKPQERKYQ
ncbi:hypothetical protein HU200_059730 [Digitaria exilis]|uniref:Jacalin-type lectin domain-containing protein n=1 Tax=Digitaria exilis TaxID=1010633 RepID=A0A835A7R1_9POAL|nr:hypothetical protein HU200_059730 [Digitaria exilis]